MWLFETRLFLLLKPDFETNPDSSHLPPGKRLVFIQAQEWSEDWHVEIYQRYESLFKKIGFSDIFVIHAYNISKPYELKERDDIMKQAEEVVEKIMSEK